MLRTDVKESLGRRVESSDATSELELREYEAEEWDRGRLGQRGQHDGRGRDDYFVSEIAGARRTGRRPGYEASKTCRVDEPSGDDAIAEQFAGDGSPDGLACRRQDSRWIAHDQPDDQDRDLHRGNETVRRRREDLPA